MKNIDKWESLGDNLTTDADKLASVVKHEIDELDSIEIGLYKSGKNNEAVEVFRKLIVKAINDNNSELVIKYKNYCGNSLYRLNRYTEALSECLDIELNYKSEDNKLDFCNSLINQIRVALKTPLTRDGIKKLINKSIHHFNLSKYSISIIHTCQAELEIIVYNYHESVGLLKEAISTKNNDNSVFDVIVEYYHILYCYYKLNDENNFAHYLKKLNESETSYIVTKQVYILVSKSMLAELQRDYKSAWKFAIDAL